MAGPNLRFTQAEVVANAGIDPWDIRTRFTSEINVDAMARAGDTLLEAAQEGRAVKDLAVRADQISEASGGNNGAPLAVAPDRFDVTNVKLRDDKLDRAVECNFRAMGRAQHTETLIDAKIAGPAGLESRINGLMNDTREEWAHWVTRHQQLSASYAPTAQPPTETYNGRTVTFGRSLNGELTLPVELPEQIRQTHLDKAGRDARLTAEDMDRTIARYRRDLTELADELNTMGFDVSAGPVGAFVTPQMAEFAAHELNAELAKANPDPHVVNLYTEQLGAIADLQREDPSRILTAQERQYLERFYTTASPEALGKLGQLDYTFQDDQRDVANGITMLLNPEAGGINPQHAPEAIREFVYDYQNGDLARSAPLGQFNEALQRFNGFGNLMDQATVAPGEQFAGDLARAAVGVEQLTAYGRHEISQLENAGSSGLLSTASLNSLASARLLNDVTFRTDLLSQGWDDSTGAGELITSGTTVPDGMNPADHRAREFTEASRNVLLAVGTDEGEIHKDTILGLRGPMDPTGSAPPDNQAMVRALSGVATRNLDFLSLPGGGTQVQGGGELGYMPLPEHQWGFAVGETERRELFDLMNSAEEGARGKFFRDVADWQFATATEGFDDPNHGARADAANRIGVIQGAVADVQGRDAVSELQGASTAVTGLNQIATAATGIPNPAVVGVAAPLAAATGAEAGRLNDQIAQDFEAAVDLGAIEGQFALTAAWINADESVANRTFPNSDLTLGQYLQVLQSDPNGVDPVAANALVNQVIGPVRTEFSDGFSHGVGAGG